MFVQQVVVPGSQRESWTVLGEGGLPVAPVERYLAYLSDIERSPNTVKAPMTWTNALHPVPGDVGTTPYGTDVADSGVLPPTPSRYAPPFLPPGKLL